MFLNKFCEEIYICCILLLLSCKMIDFFLIVIIFNCKIGYKENKFNIVVIVVNFFVFKNFCEV